jgi:hypothetical protein
LSVGLHLLLRDANGALQAFLVGHDKELARGVSLAQIARIAHGQFGIDVERGGDPALIEGAGHRAGGDTVDGVESERDSVANPAALHAEAK